MKKSVRMSTPEFVSQEITRGFLPQVKIPTKREPKKRIKKQELWGKV